MNKRAWLVLMIVLVSAFALAIGQPSTSASVGPVRYFPETGHTIRGDFLTTYEEAVDPVRIYGYPITEPYINQLSGRLVQYFQKAHFELIPENPPKLRVQRTLLGEILYTPGAPIPIPPDFPACRYFQETDRSVCYAFLDFFTTYGGVSQFGYPISEIEIQNDRIIQYFQRARFEWRPELPIGQRVVLSDLGRLYFDSRKENIEHLRPVSEYQIPQVILNLQARAFVNRPVTGKDGKQTLFVIVQDQNLLSISHAQVSITIKYPSGKEEQFDMPATNGQGITSLTFDVHDTSMGVAEIQVNITHAKIQQQTRTSFRIWY
jgi:hypothetical protein